MSDAPEKIETASLPQVNLRVVLQALWPVLRDYRAQFALGAMFICLSTGVEVITPILVGKTVDIAIAPARDFALLTRYCLAFLALVLFRSCVETSQALVIQWTGQDVTHDLRSLLFEKIERLPVGYFDKNPTGRLLTRVMNDIKALSELFTASISVLGLDFMTILGTVIAMCVVRWQLAMAVLVTFPLVLFTVHYFGKLLAVGYRKVRARLSEINAFLGENIAAIATIQRLGAETERLETFSKVVLKHQEAQLESLKIFAQVQPIANALNGVATATLLGLGGYWVIEGKMTIGILVAFLGYLRNLFQPIRDLVEKYNTFLASLVAAERVAGVISEPTEFDAEPLLNCLPSANAMSLVFEHVDFRYPTREEGALEDANFSVNPGHTLAIVGPTGSGKSTLIRLLLRFYEPTKGRILLGGLDLKSWPREKLRRCVGVVHQEIYLFQGTIRENLCLGQEGFSDEFLRRQCERAQLWDVIGDRGGLEMPIFEGGTNLSLGERQLLSFARVLVFDAPILVLDEATASIDPRLERKLMQAISQSLEGRTAIVIAHRLSTIQKCEDILVLEDGKIRERGSYEALIKQRGLFHKFHEIHSRG